jgi:Uma2 family endonuclease
MTLAVRKHMTLAEFLAWEERQPLRYAFDGVGPVAMTGGTLAHARIQRNLAFALTGRLRGRPCKFLGSDVKIKDERRKRSLLGRVRHAHGGRKRQHDGLRSRRHFRGS